MNNHKNKKPQPQGQTKKHMPTQIIVFYIILATIITLVLTTPATLTYAAREYIHHYNTVAKAVPNLTFHIDFPITEIITMGAASTVKQHINPDLYHIVTETVPDLILPNKRLLSPFPVTLAISIATQLIK